MKAGKTPKGTKTKNRIITSAINLIKEKGIENTTLVEVCSVSNVAQGTFYHYFHSVNDIINEILKIEGEDLSNYYREIETDSTAEQLEKLMSFQLDYYERKGKAIVAQLIKNDIVPQSGESIIENLLPIRPLLTKIIKSGQQSKSIPDSVSPEMLSKRLVAVLMLYTIWWIKDTEDQTLKEMISDQLRMEIAVILSP